MRVDDNSEAIYNVGTTIELCGNKFQFKSDMLLILAVPLVGLISMATVVSLLHSTLAS